MATTGRFATDPAAAGSSGSGGDSSMDSIAEPSTDGLQESLLEPVNGEEIDKFKRRLSELGFESGDNPTMEPRERELAQMVFRLLGAPRPDADQIFAQAKVISELHQQREYLVQMSKEERARWDSEREGWDRMAEALIAQRSRDNYSSMQVEELEHQCNTYKADNRALREALTGTQTRLTALEIELAKLKPILLMQPFAGVNQPTSLPSLTQTASYLSSFAFPIITGSVAAAAHKTKVNAANKKKKERESRHVVSGHRDPDDFSEEDIRYGRSSTPPTSGAGPSSSRLPSTPPSNPTGHGRPNTPGSAHYRDKQPILVQPYAHLLPPTHSQYSQSNVSATGFGGPSNQTIYNAKKVRSARSRNQALMASFSSDARSDHLMLAARSVGRARAAILAGIVTHEKEKEEERERERAKWEIERMEKGERIVGPGGKVSHYRRIDPADLEKAASSSVPGAGQMNPPEPPKTPKCRKGKTSAAPPSTEDSGRNSTTLAQSHPPPLPEPGPSRLPYTYSSNHGFGAMLAPSNATTGSPGSSRNYAATHSYGVGPTAGSSSTPPRARKSHPHHPGVQSPLRSPIPVGDDSQKASGTPSAMDSLLTAARSILDPEVTAVTTPSGSGRRRSAPDTREPESPTPKRRKTGPSSGSSEHPVPGSLGRVRSALDVLADQAAVFSSGSTNSRATSTPSDEEGPSSPLNGSGSRAPRPPRPPPKDRTAPPQPRARMIMPPSSTNTSARSQQTEEGSSPANGKDGEADFTLAPPIALRDD